MANPANNPLFKHFRQPSIYLKLPSNGQFYANGSINFPTTGEIPVYPMTVKDELTLKTPDALMNGQGMAEIIKSCCPNITNPWDVPIVDVDAIFIAIRLASYGSGMDITTTCPHCQAKNEYTVDLRSLLDRLKTADYTKPAVINGLTFYFKPQRYEALNKNNLIAFEEHRLVNSIVNSTLPEEEKARQFKENFKRIAELNISTVVDCINYIQTEDGTVVNDANNIREFLDNCDRKTYDEVKAAIDSIIIDNRLDPLNLTCDECHKEYNSQLTFDQSNFFG